MKKVGILSMQKVDNYGSILQAYALKSLIEQIGGDCHFIDIKYGKQLYEQKTSTHKNSLLRRIKTEKDLIISKRFIKAHKEAFLLKKLLKKFPQYREVLELEKIHSGKFDLVVIGSDEVFNCCQICPWGYTLQLFGSDINSNLIVSYAASFGHTTLADLKQNKIDIEIGLSMRNFNSISVRDDNSYCIVNELVGIPPKIHLDPVLIYDFSTIIKNSSVNESNYILVYSYPGRITDQAEIDYIRSMAKKHKKEIVCLYGYYSWADKYVIPESIFDVIKYFDMADFVITDTFHGSIFSIITHSQFLTLVRPKNFRKITYLLNFLGLSDYIVTDINNTSSVPKSINYESVDKIIVNEREKSIKYLTSFLQ